MNVGAWIVAAALAYLALGAFVGSGLRSRRDKQTRPTAPLETVRDEQLDIGPAINRRPR